ncbi:hypothetical protein LJU32_02400 [Pseudomonas sp. B21_DOA]|nr:hypothetical protein LJU32_02400 [Pseudomonas sp. B21_DOA]
MPILTLQQRAHADQVFGVIIDDQKDRAAFTWLGLRAFHAASLIKPLPAKTIDVLSLHSSRGSHKAEAVMAPSFDHCSVEPTNGHAYSPRKPGRMAFRQDVDANQPPDGH